MKRKPDGKQDKVEPAKRLKIQPIEPQSPLILESFVGEPCNFHSGESEFAETVHLSTSIVRDNIDEKVSITNHFAKRPVVALESKSWQKVACSFKFKN